MTITTTAATTFLLLLFLLHISTAISRTEFFACSQANAYPKYGAYRRNLFHLLSSLVHAAPPIGFSNITEGTSAPEIIHGLALCRGDLNSSTCSSCLTTAAVDIVNQCPGSLSGAVWYDRCRLRYSNIPFFASLTPNPIDPYFYELRTVSDRRLFQDRFNQLARELQRRAAFGNGTGLYASGSIDLEGPERLYGMVQCTRDLSGELCARCLEDPIRQIACCESNVEITFQGGSCYLRYALYLFFNESVVAPPVVQPLRPPSVAGNASAEQPGTFTLNSGGKKHNYAAIVVIVLGVALVSLLLFIAFKASRKSKPKHIILGKSRNLDLNEGPGLKFNRRLSSKKLSFLRAPRSPDSRPLDIQKLDIQTLRISTDNFSENKLIGRGDFGLVYKGDIPGQEFVVKRFMAKPKVELAELQKEFRTFSKLQHPNIVKLLAFHIEKEGEDMLVVYEYLPNTSLDRILFDNRRRVLLDWGRRFKIIQGVAQGLLHLHGETGLNIVHQNLKASNILLDKQMAPKISDSCLPRLFVGSHGSQHNKKSSSVSDYMAPEIVEDVIASAKSDVFSYGVLVLEIVTGQRNRDLLGSESTTNLLSYVWQYWREEKALQVLDWSLGELYKGHEVLRCIHVGLLCVQEDPEKRPNMASIVHMLNSYSFTLPSPSAPGIVRRKKNGSGQLDGNGNSGNWDWKFYNQNSSQMSPRSPSGWADVKLESR